MMFVLLYAAHSEWPGAFVAVDEASGGYPYAVVDPWRARRWPSVDAALKYAEHFRDDIVQHAFPITIKVEK